MSPEPATVLPLVLVSAAITWALRALPFAALAPLRRSATVRYLGVHLPLGVMVMLALYTARAAGPAGGRAVLAFGTAVVATLGLHLGWRRPVLSIVGGTAVHAVLATALGVGG